MHEGRPTDPLIPERWRTLRVESLDGESWGEAPADATGLVRRCHEYRTRPLGDLTPAELRLLLGQKIAPTYLIPRAVEFLLVDPLLEADCYPGDLLKNVCLAIVGGASLHAAAETAARQILGAFVARDGVDRSVQEAVDQAKSYLAIVDADARNRVSR